MLKQMPLMQAYFPSISPLVFIGLQPLPYSIVMEMCCIQVQVQLFIRYSI